jgi:hypothetical protein
MADTDDDQTVALEPDQHLQGDDDTEAAGERRDRTSERDDERLAAVVGLTPEGEAARREEERQERLAEEDVEAAEAEEIERVNADERALEEKRRRDELLDAKAVETARAIELAHVAESASNRHRRLADALTQQATSDWTHGNHLRDEAAARPDEPGADATAAAGRRYQRAAGREDRGAEYDDRIAGRYDVEAREYRRDAHQPDPIEAVRNPPTEPPEARTRFVRSRLKKQVRDRSSEPDIGLGD